MDGAESAGHYLLSVEWELRNDENLLWEGPTIQS